MRVKVVDLPNHNTERQEKGINSVILNLEKKGYTITGVTFIDIDRRYTATCKITRVFITYEVG